MLWGVFALDKSSCVEWLETFVTRNTSVVSIIVLKARGRGSEHIRLGGCACLRERERGRDTSRDVRSAHAHKGLGSTVHYQQHNINITSL